MEGRGREKREGRKRQRGRDDREIGRHRSGGNKKFYLKIDKNANKNIGLNSVFFFKKKKMKENVFKRHKRLFGLDFSKYLICQNIIFLIE